MIKGEKNMKLETVLSNFEKEGIELYIDKNFAKVEFYEYEEVK